MASGIPGDLFSKLRCPLCRRPVVLAGDRLACDNPACGLRYPVKDGIPVMLAEEAEPQPAPIREAAHRP